MSGIPARQSVNAPALDAAVIRISPDAPDVPELIEVMRRAFDRDAHINWLVRQGGKRGNREAALTQLFDLLLTRMGGELYATRDRKAAALWFSPGDEPTWSRQSGFFLRLLDIAGPIQAVRRGLDLKRMEHRHPTRRHHYLQLLGVDPDFRHRGHGGALLGHLLAQADISQTPIYLETSSPENAAFYSRRGFDQTAETVLTGGLRLWSLLREPTRRV